jgi:methionyl-tRNA formyltransferase
VRLIEVQRAGKQPMRVEDFLRGTPIGRDFVLS